MMRRFSRRRQGPGDGQRSAIDGNQWWPRVLAEGSVPTAAFEPWTDVEVPGSLAIVARATLQNGSPALVAFSPTSASEALVGGLAAAQQASAEAPFTGSLFVVAPHWPMASRQLLDWIGQLAYSVEPIAAASLGDAGSTVESERVPRLLAASATQLAARMGTSESRAAFLRAAASLEGLAAKHGGCVRVGIDRLELVVLARRVAEIRTDGENAVLETQVNGRHSTPISAADLAGALDGLEGQLRRRLNDHKVREGEDGLRGQVVAQMASGSELRNVRAWPSPGAELDVVDAVGVDATGTSVILAVRQEFEWTALVAVLEALSSLAPLMPLLLADAGPPLRLGRPRLLLAAERFAAGLERTVAALTLSFEFRVVSGRSGASLDFAQRAAGEGAESRFGRRGRRRGGRDRFDEPRGGRDDADSESESGESAGDSRGESRSDSRAGARGDGRNDGRGDARRESRGERSAVPLAPRAMREAERLGDDVDDEDLEAADAVGPRADRGRDDREGGGDRDGREAGDGGRRGRRRRRSRRGGSGGNGESSSDDLNGNGSARALGRDEGDGSGEDRDDEIRGSEGEDTRPARARFEEVSLMDLDDAPGAGPERSDSERGRGDRHRRSRRRGRRGTRGEEASSPRTGSDATADDGEATPEAIALPLVGADAAIEDDFVDADDLSEILSRLPDEVPDYEPSEPRYEDEEEDDGESPGRPFRGEGRGRGRGDDDDDAEDALRAAARRRAAILVHADPDSLAAAVLLARDVRQLEGLWVYPQSELMTFFRSIATDLRDDTPIVVVGFTPSPARDVVQAAALYRGRLSWFDRHAWPPEDLLAMRNALGAEAVIGGDGLDSVLPLVLETCIRRSRFSDKLVDLATSRFSQHDFERWGRVWRHRFGEIARKTGDIRGDVASLLAGRPSDLAKEAALLAIPPAPPEVEWVAARDFRLVHFGAHVLVVLEVEAGLDPALCARIARERYDASLSLASRIGEEVFTFAGDEVTGRRALDYQAVAHHLVDKLEWVERRPDADHVARFRIRDLGRRPERLEEVIAEIAMGRSQLER